MLLVVSARLGLARLPHHLRLARLFAAKVGVMDLDRLTKVIVVSLVLLVLLMSGIPAFSCWSPD